MIYDKKKIKFFSLIELLLVLLISSILIGISMPSINSILKGTGVEKGAQLIGTTLKASRKYAISQRKNIALIIPIQSLPTDYLNASFRPCAVTISNSTYTFDYWIPDEKWEFLPIGAAIIDIDNSSGYNGGSFDAASDILNVDFSSIGSSIGSLTAKGVIFRPTGRGVGERKYIVVGNSNVLTGVSPGSDHVDIIIDQYNGRVNYEE